MDSYTLKNILTKIDYATLKNVLYLDKNILDFWKSNQPLIERKRREYTRYMAENILKQIDLYDWWLFEQIMKRIKNDEVLAIGADDRWVSKINENGVKIYIISWNGALIEDRDEDIGNPEEFYNKLRDSKGTFVKYGDKIYYIINKDLVDEIISLKPQKYK